MDPSATGGSHALSPAHVGGRRRRSSSKKLRLVKKSTVRRMLKKQGLKMRGGVGEAVGNAGAPAPGGETVTGGGPRRRHSRRHRKSHRGFGKMFGMGMY